MNEDTSRARAFSGLLLVARRELAMRLRGTAFRVSTIILLAATVAGIATSAALIGRTQHFTVAVTAQAPPWRWRPRCALTPTRPGLRSRR